MAKYTTLYMSNGSALEEVLVATDYSLVKNKPSNYPPTVHDHPISEVTGLQSALDAKAASVHAHSISQVTGLQGALDAKAASSNVYTKGEVDARMVSVYRHIGSTPTLASLASVAPSPAVGDVWNLEDTGMNVVWNGSAWDNLGSVVDLTPYAKTVKVGSSSYNSSSGTVSLPAYPTTLPASDVYSWAKAENRPTYTQDEVGNGTFYKRVTQAEKDKLAGIAAGAQKHIAPTATEINAVISYRGGSWTPAFADLPTGTGASQVAVGNHTHSNYSTSDTKTTAGSNATTGKIFLVGAGSQEDFATTYSNSNVYANLGALYSENKKVIVEGDGRLTNARDPNAHTLDSHTGTLAVSKGGTNKTSIAANKMLYASAANTYAEVNTTSFGRSVLGAFLEETVEGLFAEYSDSSAYSGSSGNSTKWNNKQMRYGAYGAGAPGYITFSTT